MSNEHNTSVSAWLDNEEHSDELIDLLKHDSELADTMSRYQLIGDVMRGETSSPMHFDIADRVAAELANEPTILAPAAEKEEQQSAWSANVVPLFRQVAHFAMAATVTGVMILGVQQYNANQVEVEGDITPRIVTNPVGGVASPVSFVQDAPAKSNQESVVEQRRRINAFLTDHQQQLRLRAVADDNSDKAESVKEQNQK